MLMRPQIERKFLEIGTYQRSRFTSLVRHYATKRNNDTKCVYYPFMARYESGQWQVSVTIILGQQSGNLTDEVTLNKTFILHI